MTLPMGRHSAGRHVGNVQDGGARAVDDREDIRPRRSGEMKARLDMIGIVVEDMGRSLAFYRELGMELPEDADGRPHVETKLPGGLRLAWDTEETIRTFEPLVSLGYDGHKAPWDAPWGQRYALVRDPDGNAVDLFCPL